MFEEKLNIFEKRYKELSNKLYQPDIASDPEEYQRIMKEYKEIEPIVEEYGRYKKAKSTIDEASEIINDSTADSEMKELAQEESIAAKTELEESRQNIKLLLLPKDPNDERNVIVEIRGGAGGEEAALFSAVLYRMYSMYADKKGFKTELLNVNATELGGYKEISFMINGQGAYSRLKFESGVHRVQRVPETETQGRIHTSTVYGKPKPPPKASECVSEGGTCPEIR